MQEVPCRLSGRIRLAVAALVMAAVSMAGPVQSAWAGGDAIVYAKQGDIYRADPNGANPLRLTVACGCGRPTLSPDGELVAFDGGSAGKLYLTDIDGTSLRTVLSDPTMKPLDPAFLPDGRTLVFKQNGQGTTADNFYSDLYKIAIDGTGLTRLTAFSGREDQPTVSAGGLIAFSYQATNGSGKIATINSDGSGYLNFSPKGASAPTAPAISPNGSRIAFGCYKSSKDVGNGTREEIFLVSSTGGSAQQITSNTYWDSNPTWTTDGLRIAYSTERRPPPPEHPLGGSPQDVWIFDSSSGVHSPLIEDTWPGVNYPAYRQARPALNQVSAEALVTRYAPMLKYDSQELYFADSIETITDNPGNALRRIDGSSIVDSPFGIEMLGWPQYMGGAQALDTDYLDERNDTYQLDAQRMHGDPAYANRVYGRAKQDPDTGKWWLQYWFWYYYNPLGVDGVGVHEGDWEMIQIGLDSNGAPDRATYAQHGGAEKCDWNVVERTWSSSGFRVPIVYVANGSHASYFFAGSYDRDPLPWDQADGTSPNSTQPSVETIGDSGPGWVLWKGFWGASTGDGPGYTPSPRGPSQQGGGKWVRPSTFDGEANACTASGSTMGTSAAAATAPSMATSNLRSPEAPVVSAVRRGRSVVVRYALDGGRTEKLRPTRLILTVHPKGTRFSPSGGTYSAQATRGTKSVRLPSFGRGPYVLRASAVTSEGRRGPITSLQIP